MKLLAGLGNPGKEYESTRHNVGFMVVDHIAGAAGAQIDRKKFKAELGEAGLGGVKTLLVKPQTFMNLSGESIAGAASFYKIAPADVIVIHDELDLEPGRIQIKVGGGHGGHNGLRSIIAHLGPDFVRIRVGIGKPAGHDTAGYVLGPFDKRESQELPFILDRAAEASLCVLRNGPTACMNEFNKRDALADRKATR
ncbi:aminoacyl-tRNA hydrolase [Vulgatibacter incomptus]|uniref:Peptidyl-tRNA hydrolase n=1 Tax=Vulgatibacter incomptus TaxID=1391653 RepID=A0A0K1PEJ9_9BACT|nr:aminoacyl-tRNA hydrolase [Vulgatibacter incomptus]AKU91927.1 Peptidyl-tRNA hydrolase [Vulgatibacter incomptus]